MAANTRPYLCIFNGKAHMVDAKDPGAVVRHIVGAAVTELRPARASEVAQWARDKKEIETAGVVAAAQADSTDTDTDASFGIDDAGAWLVCAMGVESNQAYNQAQGVAAQAWETSVKSDRMTLLEYDLIRQAAPAFEAALLEAIQSDGTAEGLRGVIEDDPLSMHEVVKAIAKQKRHENFEPVGASDKMVGDTGHLDA